MASAQRKQDALPDPSQVHPGRGREEEPVARRQAEGKRTVRTRSRPAQPEEQSRLQPSGEQPPRKRHKRGRRETKGAKRRSRALRLLYWGVVASLWGVIASLGVLVWVGAHLPPIQSLEVPKRAPTIQIAGMNGRILTTRGDTGGPPIPLKELPSYLPKAFIAIEDRRFYSHHGVDPLGIMRAALTNLLRRGVAQGGSTITQQLAKNLFLTQERTIERKVQEIGLALWLEWRFSKAQILELYLNRVYFGSGAYGVEAAAQRYFGKSARQVTLAEAALLAGIIKSPTRLAPTHNYKGAEQRARLVIAAMANGGFLSADSAKTAFAHAPQIVKPAGAGLVNYAGDWVMDLLNDLVGRVEQDIVVETTIDPALQAAAERAVTEELTQRGEKFAVEQGALVAMSPDGAIRALVGGRNYGESQFNRAISAKRQPGSAFKPFVYLTALERGLTPDSLREDRPINIKGWRPENYGREYFGPVTLTRALSLSLNTVAVRLALEVGPQSVVRTAHRLGIASKLEPNASIALGTSEVSLLELVSAFAPFANGGMAITPHIVERVRGVDGAVLYLARHSALGRVVEERHVAMMNTMLQETLLTGTGRKAELPGLAAAGKTGTSQDFRDAWFVGYTGALVAGVWLGNDDNSAMRKVTGGGLPAEIWSRFMKAAHRTAVSATLPGVARDGGRPTPPANIPTAPSGSVRDDIGRSPPSSGMDGWLLDRLFGRR